MHSFDRYQHQVLVLLALVLSFGPLSMDAMEQDGSEFEGILKLNTDAPAVLDAPVTITATLENVGDFSPPFYFTFSKLEIRIFVYVKGIHELYKVSITTSNTSLLKPYMSSLQMMTLVQFMFMRWKQPPDKQILH